MLSTTLRFTLAAVTALATASFLPAPSHAGDRQVHNGTACFESAYENNAGRNWRSFGGYLANNSGATKSFICPAMNDRITNGMSYASAVVTNRASCYAGATAWGAYSGSYTSTRTSTTTGPSTLALPALATPNGSIFGSYRVICRLPNNASILQYYINQN